MQCWSRTPTAVRLYDNLNVLIERNEETQQALYGKLPELPAQHLGDIGLPDAEKLGGLDLFEAALLQEGVDLEDQLRLDQMLRGIWYAKILEHVPASDFVFL